MCDAVLLRDQVVTWYVTHVVDIAAAGGSACKISPSLRGCFAFLIQIDSYRIIIVECKQTHQIKDGSLRTDQYDRRICKSASHKRMEFHRAAQIPAAHKDSVEAFEKKQK